MNNTIKYIKLIEELIILAEETKILEKHDNRIAIHMDGFKVTVEKID